MLYCALQRLHFYTVKACGKSISTVFLTAFAHFVSLCHILVILAIIHSVPIIYLLRWSVISDFCHCGSLKAPGLGGICCVASSNMLKLSEPWFQRLSKNLLGHGMIAMDTAVRALMAQKMNKQAGTEVPQFLSKAF